MEIILYIALIILFIATQLEEPKRAGMVRKRFDTWRNSRKDWASITSPEDKKMTRFIQKRSWGTETIPNVKIILPITINVKTGGRT